MIPIAIMKEVLIMSDESPARHRVLVADDDAAIRRGISKLLENAGSEVSEAADGIAALNAIQEKQYDLVFLDIWMPHLSGLEVLSRIRTGANRPKVIVTTSDGTSETLLRAVKEQAYDYLSKPFPPRKAVEVAQRALSADQEPAIEVLSARPHWVELLIPCTREAAERIQTFLMKHVKRSLHVSGNCCSMQSNGVASSIPIERSGLPLSAHLECLCFGSLIRVLAFHS